MTPDTQELVKRLREKASDNYNYNLMLQAADAIEALTLALQQERERLERTRRHTMTIDAPEIEGLAIRAGCSAADVHLKCSYPECSCADMPKAILAATESLRLRLQAAEEVIAPFRELGRQLPAYIPDDARVVLTDLNGGMIDTSKRIEAIDLRRAASWGRG